LKDQRSRSLGTKM